MFDVEYVIVMHREISPYSFHMMFSDMWPFALLSLLVIPFMGFATALEMKQFLGADEGGDKVEDGCDSPGGIIVETLLNIRTVSALTLEKQRIKAYEDALAKSEGNVSREFAGLDH